METKLYNKFKNIVEVDTTNVVTEVDHPRVYYKINPKIGYVVCNYTNTCFKLSKKADLNTKDIFIYKGDTN